MTGGPREQARASYDAGDFRQAREAALEGLREDPGDVELLRLAGRAGVELGAEDAVDQLRAVAERLPDDAQAWHDLGEALVTEGRTEEASEVFRKALELNPDDELAMAHLGYTAAAAGDQQDAVSYLSKAAAGGPGASSAVISLVDLYRTLGKHDEALAAAVTVAAQDPEDAIAALDVAELSLTVGKLDEASAAFARLRQVDDDPGHELYPLHGMIQVELRRDDLPRALALAREAAEIDRYGRTAGVIAFLQAQIAEPGEEPPPSREEVDAALAASLSEYRRMRSDDRRLAAEEQLG